MRCPLLESVVGASEKPSRASIRVGPPRDRAKGAMACGIHPLFTPPDSIVDVSFRDVVSREEEEGKIDQERCAIKEVH